jgi:hypothetical protein
MKRRGIIQAENVRICESQTCNRLERARRVPARPLLRSRGDACVRKVILRRVSLFAPEKGINKEREKERVALFTRERRTVRGAERMYVRVRVRTRHMPADIRNRSCVPVISVKVKVTRHATSYSDQACWIDNSHNAEFFHAHARVTRRTRRA